MANIKFSAFTQKVTQANVDFLVGYTGADNVRITPAALGDGIYLPLGGGNMTGDLVCNDGVAAAFGTGIDAFFKHDGANFSFFNDTGNVTFNQRADDKDIIFNCDDGAGGTATYFFLDGSATNGTSVLGATKFPDKSKIYIGSGADLEIFHDGSNTYLENYTGDFIFTQAANDKDIQFKSDDGAGGTTLYYYLDGSIVRNRFPKNVYLEDDVKLQFGDPSTPDLEIYHDGGNSFIDDAGTGGLYIRSNFLVIGKYTGELGILALEDGTVELYYDNGKRLETTATGVKVIDEVSIGTNLVHTGDTDTKLAFSTNNISLIAGGGTHFVAESDQTTHLYSGNATTLVCDVNQGSTFSGNVDLKADNVNLDWMHADADQVLRIEIDGGNDAYFSVTGSNDFYFRTNSTTALTINGSQNAIFAGDIEVENSANGLILESPDGTRYRVTVANGGTLSVAAV